MFERLKSPPRERPIPALDGTRTSGERRNLDDSRAAVQLHALTETTPDALVTIGAESRIQFANPAVEDVFGYTPEELVGELLTVLMSESLARRHTEAIDRYLRTGTRQLDWDHVELVGRHKGGHDVPLGISFSEFTVDGEQYFTGVMRDISERKALEAERDLLHATKDQIVRADSFAEGSAMSSTAVESPD